MAKKKSERVVCAAFGDDHGGLSLGLLNPDTVLMSGDKTYIPKLNEVQEHLWYEVHEPNIQRVMEFAGKDPVAVLHLGDSTQGNRYGGEKIVSSAANQFRIAVSNFDPWFRYKNTKLMRLMVGTAVHSFDEATSEDTISTILQHKYPKRDIRMLYHDRMLLNGARLDLAHHGPNESKREWLKGNIARYYLRDRMKKEHRIGKKPAHVYLRGHYHSFVREFLDDENDNINYEAWLIVTPAMCMMNEFAIKVTRSEFIVKNGMVVFEVIDGEVTKPFFIGKTLDTRTQEKITL